MSAEPGLSFVDTNVFLYAHDSSSPQRQRRALDLLRDLTAARTALSVQVLQEFFVNATAKLKSPLPARVALGAMADMSTWTVHEPGAHDVLAAAEIRERSGVSFWDAMIVRSAAQLGCEILWSEDLNAGQVYEGVEVRNPFD